MDDEREMNDVAVIIAVRNCERFIKCAVLSALRQNKGVGQIIVVDDGSTDRTVACVEPLTPSGVLIVPNPGTGVSSARNYGSSLSRCEWLLFLDADDQLAPGGLGGLLAAASASPKAVMVYGDYERISADGSILASGWKTALASKFLNRGRKKPSGRILSQLIRGNFIINGGIAIVRKSTFQAIGGFHTELSLCEDWRLWCQLASIGDIIHAPGKVMDYRIHPHSVMMKTIRKFDDFRPALEVVFQDLRATEGITTRNLERARRAAEASLKAYCIAQAARGGRKIDALRMSLEAIRDYPREGGLVLLRLFGGLSGL